MIYMPGATLIDCESSDAVAELKALANSRPEIDYATS